MAVSPIIFSSDAALGRGIENFGSALGEALNLRGARQYQDKMSQAQRLYEQRQAEQQAQQRVQGATILGSILKNLGSNPTPNALAQARNIAAQQGVDSGLIQSAFGSVDPGIKERAKTEGSNSFLSGIFGNNSQNSYREPYGIGEKGNGGPNYTSADMATQLHGGSDIKQSPQMPNGSELESLESVEPYQANGREQETHPEAKEPFDINKVGEEEIFQMIASPYENIRRFGEALLAKRNSVSGKEAEETKRNLEQSKPAREEINSIRTSIGRKKLAINMAENAINSGEVGFLSLNKLADITGIDALKTAHGAALGAAAKENLFSNLANVTAKGQNVFIEKAIFDNFPKIGQSKQANMTFLVAQKAEIAMEEAYLKAWDDIVTREGGAKADTADRAKKEASKEYNKIINKSSYQIRELQEEEIGDSQLYKDRRKKVDPGTPLTPKMARIMSADYSGDLDKLFENATRLGYTIPNYSEVT